MQYRKQQAAVVKSAIETVQSYLPVVEASSQLVLVSLTYLETSVIYCRAGRGA